MRGEVEALPVGRLILALPVGRLILEGRRPWLKQGVGATVGRSNYCSAVHAARRARGGGGVERTRSFVPRIWKASNVVRCQNGLIVLGIML